MESEIIDFIICNFFAVFLLLFPLLEVFDQRL